MIDFPASPTNGQQFAAAGRVFTYNGSAWVGTTPAQRGYAVADLVLTASSNPPPGTLKANGSAVSRVTYADLFSVIGTTYGAGDGSTTFNLPDWRGEFFRAFDDGRGVDAGRLLNSAQGGAIESHIHAFDTPPYYSGEWTTGDLMYGSNQPTGNRIRRNTEWAGGAETRPRNIALLACIAYRASLADSNPAAYGWQTLASGNLAGSGRGDIPMDLPDGYDEFEIHCNNWIQAGTAEGCMTLQVSTDGINFIGAGDATVPYYTFIETLAYTAGSSTPAVSTFPAAGAHRIATSLNNGWATAPICPVIRLKNFKENGSVKHVTSETLYVPNSGTWANSAALIRSQLVMNAAAFMPPIKRVRIGLATQDLASALSIVAGRYVLLGLRR